VTNEGPSGDGTCWIGGHDPISHYYQLLFFIPIILYWGICVGALLYSGAPTVQTFQRATMAKLLRRLKIFVVLFIVAWCGRSGSISRVIRM
jgi:hypothetical protein